MIRAFDIVLAVLVLMLTLPITLLAALLVRVTSPGPVFYVGQRAGLNGIPFGMLKFRTMTARGGGGAITIGGDSRITPVGFFLRKTKIDELPQLINVLRGDMSIVGPRPEALSIVETYYNDLDRQLLRVPPGVSCPGQIYYYLKQVDEQPPDGMDPEIFYVDRQLPIKLAYDMYWMRRRTFLFNLRVIVDTICVIANTLFPFGYRWEGRPEPGYDLTPRSQTGSGIHRPA